MKGKIDPQIEPAIKQIATVMKGRTIKKPNAHIDHIVEQCNDVFGQLRYYLTYGQSEEHISHTNDLLKGKKREKWKYVLTHAKLKRKYINDEYIDLLAKADRVFPSFVEFDFGKILQIDENSDVLKFLPYLLTAFYLNSNRMKDRKVRPAISDVFKCDPETDVSEWFVGVSYYRDVDDFCRLFSYESFLTNLFEIGRTDSKTALGNIKDIDSFREYIKGTATMLVSIEEEDDHIRPPQLYFSQIYKVFIYSVIASACADEFQENPGVDYEASWALFSDHTDCFAAASFALSGKADLLSAPNFSFLYALTSCRFTLQSMGVDEGHIEIAQKFLERTKTEMPRDEIKKITEKDEITAEKMYQCYTYLFRTYFSPVVYNPFRCPFIFDNLLNRNKLAYIVVQPRKKRSKTAKSS